MKVPTSALFRVVGTLVALMLSLAFAEDIVELRAIENAVERGAAAIFDMFNDLQRFDDEGTREIRTILLDYTQAVVEDEWPALSNNNLAQRAGALKRQLVEHVWNLELATPVQEKLWSQILTDTDAISDFRLIRLDNALAEPPVYIYAIIFGFLATMACFGGLSTTGPTRCAGLTLHSIHRFGALSHSGSE